MLVRVAEIGGYSAGEDFHPWFLYEVTIYGCDR